ncbi:MAG TPA: hypothetical protein VHQ03_11955 [Candidatus Dormibacteraeota bacterium]|nr:hypothetical protein [Candidatus Dormibacteraeota bacterium]
MKVLLIVLLLASVCSQPSNSGAASGPRLAQASGLLEAQVELPSNFPPDVPIYPRARLVAVAQFTGGAKTTWGVEWETLDKLTKVLAFYQQQFNQGDWTFTLSGSSLTSFSAAVKRKSSTTSDGTLAGDSSSGVTKILLSLLAAT